ncbi:lytic polysaccharide monooxygenase [Micromonospora aurantiaca (nom. illeg.)]|uniref:lytic polysaccharide monooxygenase n=1 Tax=Micromonospora aurantiaca (nom. illeg.) TaxID=47850 RepID=UPI0033EB357B
MAARRALAALAAVAATVPLTAAPAAAHGAPTSPLSRAAACGPEGGRAQTPACRAAIAAGAAVREWDNIRVARIDGRDRERIPDGELCSGGLSAYRGLDLARADWPATTLTAGARHTFRYRTTIPHRGTFRYYVSTGSYSPRRSLTWADLEEKPFLQVTDPPIRAGAYEMRGRLPADRSGRHIVYVIWQNSDTQDTYYSCSDVIFRAVRGKPDPSPAAPKAGAAAPRTLAGAAADEPAVPVATVTDGGPLSRPVVVGAAALVVALLAAAAVGLRRTGGPPPGRPCGVRNHRAGRRRIW